MYHFYFGIREQLFIASICFRQTQCLGCDFAFAGRTAKDALDSNSQAMESLDVDDTDKSRAYHGGRVLGEGHMYCSGLRSVFVLLA